MPFDLDQTDKLLSTTRAVRKRLDLSRPVADEVINQCLELALQAPTGGNAQGWRWLVVTDQQKRKALADIYARASKEYLQVNSAAAKESGDLQSIRVFESASYLAEILDRVPVHVIPCITGPIPENLGNPVLSAVYGSIFPAVWSFQLALRSRGLGSVLTTLHLGLEAETRDLLNIPEDLVQVGLLPVAYTLGDNFKTAKRGPLTDVVKWQSWS